VEVGVGGERLVFDAGTGLRSLGVELRGQGPLTLHLFLSHVHWDHIQGLPFFAPIFAPDTTIHVYGQDTALGSLRDALAAQMRAPHFPVPFAAVEKNLEFHVAGPGTPVRIGDATVTSARGNHPGGVLLYRVDHEDSSVVYATDTEHHSDRIDEDLVRLADGTHTLIYDAMYTPAEYAGAADGTPRVGWGHSTQVAGADVARSAGVERYVLFHHDPEQDDADVAAKEASAQELFANTVAAREGLVLTV